MKMKIRRRIKGFKLGRRINRVFKWVTQRRRNAGLTTLQTNKPISRLCRWICKVKQGILKPRSSRKYIRLGQDNPVHVPKGHLAVYVGDRDGDMRRVLVPVLFLNHPLFEKLLKEAESVYGFDHPGRIVIPCPVSEFENVKSRIESTGSKCRTRGVSYDSSVVCSST